MEVFVWTYCCRCAGLQFHARIGKGCEFCGGTTFANVRPPPTFTSIDRRVLTEFRIAADDPWTKKLKR
jgi:hypothetical protein